MRAFEGVSSVPPRTPKNEPVPAEMRETPVLPRRGLLFLDAPERGEMKLALGAERYVVASCEPTVKAGALAAAVDDALEHALALRGALPPATPCDASPEAKMADQLQRTRALGVRGLALELPSLAGLATAQDLEASDGEALRALLDAMAKAPVVLLADPADRAVRVLVPTALGSLVTPSRSPSPRSAEAPMGVREGPRNAAVSPTAAPPPEASPQLPEPPKPAEPSRAELARRKEERLVQTAEWRSFAVELDAARGPKPVQVVERLFATRYLPLVSALARGEADGAVGGVVDEFRTSFERSYRDGYAALRVSGKRPPMVLDAPDIAARIARQNGARGVKLVLVDGMRFDLGERVAARMGRALGGRAVCVDRLTLWAALPTVTRTQLGLLATGPAGLRELSPEDAGPDSGQEAARGRAAGMLRRERIGSRELMKLDLVEARLKLSGPPHDERLDALADEVSDVVLKFEGTCPTRTLLCVFGDHGFRLSPSADGKTTGPGMQGGTSPEEVLVPFHAWLLGEVH